MNNKVMMARSIFGGKKTAKWDARISEDLAEAARRKWMDDGFSSGSELMEWLLAVYVFGVDHVRMMQEQRLARVSGLSDEGRSEASHG